MVKLLIVGPNGNMGRALVRRAASMPSVDVVAGVGPTGRDYVGIDLGLLVGLGRRLGAQVVDDIRAVIDDCDVVLECTRPAVSMLVLDACLEHERPFVTGTTGFSDEEAARIEKASSTIPVLRASNGSPIVHLLYDLVRRVCAEVGAAADIDIVEIHGRAKLDAPSGTAKEIGEVIADALDLDRPRAAEYGREGTGQRKPHTIQYSSIRSGGTPSTHRIMFGFQNESLELIHRAYSADAFADGLIRGALFISGRDRGFYGLEEALESR